MCTVKFPSYLPSHLVLPRGNQCIQMSIHPSIVLLHALANIYVSMYVYVLLSMYALLFWTQIAV